MNKPLRRLISATDKITNLLFPPACFGCGLHGSYICQKCSVFLGEAESICPECTLPNKQGAVHRTCISPICIDGLACSWEYQGPVLDILTKGSPHAMETFIRWSLASMSRDGRFTEFFSFIAQHSPTIIPFPHNTLSSRAARIIQQYTNLPISPMPEENSPLHILLIDDVWRDGANAHAYAGRLKDDATKSVWCYSIARVP